MAFALAGWCSILPVLAQLCPCYSVESGASACCYDGPATAAPATARQSCCGTCVPKPTKPTQSTTAFAHIHADHGEDHPWDCRCDQKAEFELFSAEVSLPKREVVRVLQPMQPMLTMAVWSEFQIRESFREIDRQLPGYLNQQRKLAELGVWRL